MSRAIVTSRILKNEKAGIDITIPEYKEVSGRLGLSNEEEYHIIVITRLPHFKTESHQPSDVVQFMVARRYTEFENLRKILDDKFSATVFPELPRKSLVKSDSAGAKKRHVACQELLEFISKLSKICTSQPFLEFLGVKTGNSKQKNDSRATELEGNASPSTETVSPKQNKSQSTSSNLFGEADESDDDLFGELNSEKPNEDLFLDPEPDDTGTDIAGTTQAHAVQLFGDEDNGGAINLPGSIDEGHEDEFGAVEDNSDLLNIEDDLDELLLKAKPKAPSKSASEKTKPESKTGPMVSTNVTVPAEVTQEEDLGSDDIMKYIAENTNAPSASLF